MIHPCYHHASDDDKNHPVLLYVSETVGQDVQIQRIDLYQYNSKELFVRIVQGNS